MALLLRANKVVAGSPDEIVVESGQIIIGSLHSSHLVISGQDVAPIHAMVEVDGTTGQTQLIEMDPDGALKLNGKPIDVVEPLKHGDVIEIGPVRIEVYDADKAPAAIAADKGRSTTVAKPGSGKAENTARATQKVQAAPVARKPTRAVHGAIFVPGKERPGGSTLEVVAYWDQSILDVRHYGGTPKKGENDRPNIVYIGNEDDGHLIGVGPRADTRNYKFAEVRGGRTSIFLNSEMRAKIRRGGSYDKVQGQKTVEIGSKDVALVKHGPISYFLMGVSLPNPTLRKLADIDGKPIIFLYAFFVYIATIVGIVSLGAPNPKAADDDAWATVLKIATPPPPPPKEVPAPKPPVEVKKPEPLPKPPKIVEPPKPKITPPSTTPKEPKPEVKKPTALQKPVPPQPADTGKTAPKGESKANDTALGRKNPSLSPGNGGGPKGGTAGAFAGQRSGNEKTDMMGVEGGKKNVMSGMNLEKLGAGIGRVSDVDGIAKINVGQQSTGGGAGGGAGSGGRNAHGFGGLGNQNSLSTGGPAQALAGLGGGAGGMGAGGLGGPGGSGTGRGRGGGGGPKAEAVVVPEGDPAVEGGLTKEEIEAVIRANLAQIKACYERNLQGNRELAGRVLTNFVIGGNGSVKTSRVVSSTLGSPGAESCIVGAIRRWKFPLPRGGGDVDVKYPFVFSPQR